jgi:hypothetical protein
MTLMSPRTVGNSSSYSQQALEEIHSEEWTRHTVEYLAACDKHRRGLALLSQQPPVYAPPPPSSIALEPVVRDRACCGHPPPRGRDEGRGHVYIWENLENGLDQKGMFI